MQSIENETDLRNYLLRAIKNTALNMMEVKKQQRTSLDSVAEYVWKDRSELTDEEFIRAVCVAADYKTVVDGIKALNENYRNVLYYHLVLDFTIADTAKALNLTVAATKQQLVRGKKKLLLILKNKGVEINA